MELKNRNILAVALLMFVTFGIYTIYYFFAFCFGLNNEMERRNLEFKKFNPFVVILLSIITFGIYFIYFIYKQTQNMEILAADANVKVSLDPMILTILSIFTGSLLAYLIWQYDVNRIISTNSIKVE